MSPHSVSVSPREVGAVAGGAGYAAEKTPLWSGLQVHKRTESLHGGWGYRRPREDEGGHLSTVVPIATYSEH